MFETYPDAQVDLLTLLAIAKLEKKTIKKQTEERFEHILEEVDQFLPNLSFSEGQLKNGIWFYVPLEGHESVI